MTSWAAAEEETSGGKIKKLCSVVATLRFCYVTREYMYVLAKIVLHRQASRQGRLLWSSIFIIDMVRLRICLVHPLVRSSNRLTLFTCRLSLN